MIRFTEWIPDVRTDAILLLFLLMLIGHGGSDVMLDSAEDPVVDELTGNSTDSWVNDSDRSPTTEPLSNARVNDTSSRRMRHRHRGYKTVITYRIL